MAISLATGMLCSPGKADRCSTNVMIINKQQKRQLRFVPNRSIVKMSVRSNSTNVGQPFIWPPKTSPWLSITSPWLMLPPTFEDDNCFDMVYQFYSLGESKVLGLRKRDCDDKDKYYPDDKSQVVGSSHGCLVLFDKYKNRNVFLCNPLTRLHIKLPSLPSGCVLTNSVISSSCCPDQQQQDDCRAVIIYCSDVEDYKLSFCCPAASTSSTAWTPLGDLTGYSSCVYSTAYKLFFCCRKRAYKSGDYLEAWDLTDPLFPRMIPMHVNNNNNINYPVAARSKEKSNQGYCLEFEFLVVAADDDERLFLVRRYIEHWMGPHGYCVEDKYYGPKMGFDETIPYKTLGFYVYEYGSMRHMDRSLDGLALFVGSNSGFAVSANEFPELKPDSIYYIAPPEWCHGGPDGIFDYRDETFSSCFYPRDV